MAVRTRSPRVDRLVGAAFALIMSEHRLSCADCPGRKRCVLLKIARERKLRLRPVRFKKLVRPAVIDESLKTIVFDRSHCVLCGHCIWACRELAHVGALGFSQRGYRRVVTTFGDRPLADSPCLECGECVKVCPVGAISFKAGLEQKKRQNDRSGR
jgi:bidirectional [NiFe] hydrogenase diaphorase subunit